MNWEPIQHLAPVPNDVNWYYIMFTILVGSALLSYGVAKITERWEEELEWPEWVSNVGEALGIILGTGLGALSGYFVWHWGLGMLVGLTGATAAPWLVYRFGELIKKWKGK